MPERASLADLVRAFEALRPTGVERSRVAAALGYGWVERDDPTALAPEVSLQRSEPSETRVTLPTDAVVPSDIAVAVVVEPTPTRLFSEPVELPAPRRIDLGADALAPPEVAAAPRVPSLLPERSLRALSIELVRRPNGRGEVDVDALIARVVSGPPPTAVPFSVRSTTRLGVQVLVDQSPSMLPYRVDQNQMIDAVRTIVPLHDIEVVRFVRFPLDGEVHQAGALGAYRPPAPGTAVLLLSDLGLGPLQTARREPARWAALARSLRAAGASMTALVPIAARHWPRRLRRVIAFVEWERRTRVTDIAHALGALQ